MDRTSFDKNTEQELRESIDLLHQKGAVLGYYQLQGLLFAIACSPEHIQDSEWFDLIWLNDEPQFDDEHDARAFYKAVVELYKYVGKMASLHHYLPFSKDYSDHWQKDLADWCDGMLMGHQYLEDLWVIAIDDLDDPSLAEDVDASLCLACTFADIVRAKHLSLEQGVVLTDDHLPEAYTLFRRVLGSYAHVGKMSSQISPEDNVLTLFDSMDSVAHDEPCPCGSGDVFSKCCLH